MLKRREEEEGSDAEPEEDSKEVSTRRIVTTSTHNETAYAITEQRSQTYASIYPFLNVICFISTNR